MSVHLFIFNFSLMKLIVMIPAYNEEETIGGVIRNIPQSIEGFDEVQILVIDDGSNDRTAVVAKESGAHFIVFHGRNRGLARAFQTGIDEALRRGADGPLGQYPAGAGPGQGMGNSLSYF